MRRNFLSVAACITVAISGIVASASVGPTAAEPTLPSLSVGDVSAAEGDSGKAAISISVDLSVASTVTVKVPFSIRPSADGVTDSSDAIMKSGTLAFLAGKTSKVVQVSTVGDTVVEPDQHVLVTLGNPIGDTATIADGTGVVTLVDDDANGVNPGIEVSIGDVVVSEADGGLHKAYIPVVLSRPATVLTKVAFNIDCVGQSFLNGIGIKANGTIAFAIGSRSRNIPFTITADDEPGAVVDVIQRVSSLLSGMTVLDTHGDATVYEDDGLLPSATPTTTTTSTNPIDPTSTNPIDPTSTNPIRRVSVAHNGSDAVSFANAATCLTGETFGVDGSYTTSISADGNYVSFSSDAVNILTDTQYDGYFHRYVRNLATGTTQSIEKFTDGVVHSPVDDVVIIDPGMRFVLFRSGTTNRQTFRYDRQTRTKTLISVCPDGSSCGGTWNPSMSLDGNRVLFGVENGNETEEGDHVDLFVRDVGANTTSFVGSSTGSSDSPAISGDGSSVVFTSTRSDLVAGDVNNFADVFKVEISTGATTLVNLTSSGAQELSDLGFSTRISTPSINYNGRFILFRSMARNLAWHASDYVVRDTVLNTTTLVVVDTVVPASSGSMCFANHGSIDASGSRVAMVMTCKKPDGTHDLLTDYYGGFVVDLAAGTTTRFDLQYNAEPTNLLYAPRSTFIAADGHSVAFSTISPNIVAGDQNKQYDVFVAPLP